ALPFHAGAFVAADVDVGGREDPGDLGQHVPQEVEDLVGDAQDVVGDAPDLAHAHLLLGEVPEIRVGGDGGLHVAGQVDLGHDHDAPLPGVLDEAVQLVLRVGAAVRRAVELPGLIVPAHVADQGLLAPGPD